MRLRPVALLSRRISLLCVTHIAAANGFYIAYSYHGGGAGLLYLLHHGLEQLALYHHDQHIVTVGVLTLYIYGGDAVALTLR